MDLFFKNKKAYFVLNEVGFFVYSNGFCVKLSDFPELQHVAVDAPELNIDVTEILGIKKYDPPEVLGRGGATKGNFPSFIPKSDEPRCLTELKSTA